MTRERVRAQQDLPETGLRLILGCSIAATGPLTIRMPGGTVIRGTAITGLTYTVGAAAVALFQPPAAPIVIPTA